MGVVEGVSMLVEELSLVRGDVVPAEVEDVCGETEGVGASDPRGSEGPEVVQALATRARANPRMVKMARDRLFGAIGTHRLLVV